MVVTVWRVMLMTMSVCMPVSMRMVTMPVSMPMRMQQMYRWGHHHIRVTVRGQVVWFLDDISRNLRCLLAGVHWKRIMW